MIFFSGIINFIMTMLSVKAIGLVREYTWKTWLKTFITSVVITVLIMQWREIGIVILCVSILGLLISEKNKIINALFSVATAILLEFLMDLIISPFFINVVNNEIVFKPVWQVVASILNCLFSVVLCKIIGITIKKSIEKLNFFGITKKVLFKEKNFAVFVCVLVLAICIVNCLILRNANNKEDFLNLGIAISFSYFAVSLVIGFIIYKYIKNEVVADSRERQIKDITEYNENLEMLYNDMRKFRHDYINILSSMAGYIKDADVRGLREYFERRIVPIGTEMSEKDSRIGLLQNILIKEIKGVVLTKIIKAQELGIDIYIDIAEEISTVNMDTLDLSRCIGILLDNAIESAGKCEEGKIKIGFIKKNNLLIVAIINSVEGYVPPIYKIYEKGFSTKGDNRGIGLSNLREVLSKYSDATLDTIIGENEFKQILEIC